MHDLSDISDEQLKGLLERYSRRAQLAAKPDQTTLSVKLQIVGQELAVRMALAEIRKDLETLSIVVAPAA